MDSPRRTAVSYSRFSDPVQAAGDSADRQERLYKAFCERHNLTPGKEVFADRGRSGFSGAHRTKGRLGQLLEAAKGGRFDAGTVVVIEAWDRLGRLRPDRQTELVAELLRTGVSIGVCRLDDIFSEDDFGSHKWTTLAVFIQLAHQESKQKSERVGASWEMRRKKAREEGSFLRSSLPAWFDRVDGQPRLNPERAATIQRIFKLAAEGMGHTRIVRTLEKEKVPAFGAKVVRANRSRSQFSGRWTKPYIALLLRDRRVLGELQPMKADKPDGSPLVNYFTPVVTEEQFTLARAAQEDRDNRDMLGRKNGPRQGKYTNVFKSMLTHARDGEGFVLHNKGTGKSPELLLINAAGLGGQADRCYTFPYFVFEEAVLGLLKELDPAAVLPASDTAPSSADVIRAKLHNCREDLSRLKADLKSGYSRTIAEIVREAEADEVRLANELQDELARTAKPLARSWEELPTLIDLIRSADDPDAARLKVRPALRSVISSAVVLIVPKGSWRLTLVQIHFVGGSRRDYLIAHQTAGHRRAGGWSARSFASEAFGADLDLRKPQHVARIERDLLKTLAKGK